MPILTVEISDTLNERLERELALGKERDRSAFVQSLLESAMNARWKEDVENKIDESLDEIERGEVVPYEKGDCGRMAREYLKEKLARETNP